MVWLLGPVFALRFRLRLASSAEVEARCSAIAGVPVRFVRDCDAVFPIDIDEPVDLDDLLGWSER